MLTPGAMSQKRFVYALSAVLFLGTLYLAQQIFWPSSEDSASLVSRKENSRSLPAGSSVISENSRPQSIFGEGLWENESLSENGNRGRLNRPLAEQLRIEGEVNRIAQLYEARDEYGAEKELLNLIEQDPNVPEYRAMLGYLYYQWDDFEKSRAQWERMLEDDPDNSVIRARLAEVQTLLGDSEAGIQNLERILEDKPGDEAALMGMLATLDIEKGGEAPRAYLRNHFLQNPTEDGAATVYALSEAQAGNPDRAVELLSDVVERNPNHFSANHHLAVIKASLGEFEESEFYAQQAYKAASSRPDQDVAASIYSDLLLRQGKTESYVEFIEERLKENPGDLVLEAQLIRARQFLQ